MFLGSTFNCCGLGAKFHFRIHIEHGGYDFRSFALIVSELFEPDLETFIANRLLNDGSYEVGEILGVRLEINIIPKVQNYVETVLPCLPDVLFIQRFECPEKLWKSLLH